ncbi:hypothetical protein [Candidatus Amarobacter glycogenicus]|nr:hypothetical protein [Dehalococcoidia bacterium]
MDLLGAALQITERMPDTEEYRLEREFCWLAVGRTALALGDDIALA